VGQSLPDSFSKYIYPRGEQNRNVLGGILHVCLNDVNWEIATPYPCERSYCDLDSDGMCGMYCIYNQ
jgi:hypothetical protein